MSNQTPTPPCCERYIDAHGNPSERSELSAPATEPAGTPPQILTVADLNKEWEQRKGGMEDELLAAPTKVFGSPFPILDAMRRSQGKEPLVYHFSNVDAGTVMLTVEKTTFDPVVHGNKFVITERARSALDSVTTALDEKDEMLTAIDKRLDDYLIPRDLDPNPVHEGPTRPLTVLERVEYLLTHGTPAARS